jgi:hypothetical protein
MNVIKSLLIGFGLLAMVANASAAEKIQWHPGGSLVEHIEKYNAARNAESKFELDGMCISACTLITGLIEPENICATERGWLAFHSPFFVTPFGNVHSPDATRLLWRLYPDWLQDMLKEQGWDGSNGDRQADLIYLKADRIYLLCKSKK